MRTISAVAAGAALSIGPAAAARGPLSEALERYARGEHAAAVASIAPTALAAEAFTASLEPWIAAGGADA